MAPMMNGGEGGTYELGFEKLCSMFNAQRSMLNEVPQNTFIVLTYLQRD